MAGVIVEWYGYTLTDPSPTAHEASVEKHCPFIDASCKKPKSGVCSLKSSDSRKVIVCPSRLYANNHRFLAEIALESFRGFDPLLDPSGLPTLVPASSAYSTASSSGKVVVGVMGQGWDQELQLPPTVAGGASYSIDFILVAISPERDILGFTPVEVQTIDTTNSYQKSVSAAQAGRVEEQSNFGFNWENVNKRILPQLITKGLMLQGERLCSRGLFFVTTEPVFERITKRLGGVERLRTIPHQPGSITFVLYDYAWDGRVDGTPLSLERTRTLTISTSDLSIAFISPLNLPPSGAYEAKLRAKLNF